RAMAESEPVPVPLLPPPASGTNKYLIGMAYGAKICQGLPNIRETALSESLVAHISMSDTPPMNGEPPLA
ncbi:MAG TPA: hypothetical protein PKD38_13635, partial [Nitrospira sp.]|nr:hypothetical protein [Nitrospira sp.]